MEDKILCAVIYLEFIFSSIFLYIVSPIKAIHFLKIIKFSKSNLDTIARSLWYKFYYIYCRFKNICPTTFLLKKA